LSLRDFISSQNYKLKYGALFAYSPYGQSDEELESKDYKTAVKGDQFYPISGKQVQMSNLIAQTINASKDALAFGHFFDDKPILIPVRSTSQMKPFSLWAPLNIASAMQKIGLGREVSTCLERTYPIQRAATSGNRPTAKEQYDSLRVQKTLEDPSAIVLVDDVVTTGHTLVGSAKRVEEAYPKAKIFGFAAMHTITLPEKFKRLNDPVLGDITLYPSGKTHRDPD
jgi:hypothetical protein